MSPTEMPGAGGDRDNGAPALTGRILYLPVVALLVCFVIGALLVPGQLDGIAKARSAEELFLLAAAAVSSTGTRFGDEDYWPTIKAEFDEACQTARPGQRMEERVGRLLAARGMHREAVPYLVRGLDANPSYELAKTTAETAAQCGDTVAVTRGFTLARQLEPGNPDPYNSLGYYYAVQGIRLQEAESLVLTAIDLATGNRARYLPLYYDSLAWVYYRQGRLEEAWQAMQHVPLTLADPFIDQHRLAIQRALLEEGGAQPTEEGPAEAPLTESAPPTESAPGEGAGP